MPKNRANTPIASWVPFGLGHTKPNHYWEMLRSLWENRDNLRYAWRILRHGVCDGCSLGPRGLSDDAMKGVHLCLVRLKMLRTSTMPALDIRKLENVSRLESLDSRELREFGRLPVPMLRRRGKPGFHLISWDEAFHLLGDCLRGISGKDPDRLAIYTTSRGLTNEVYYVAQKLARLLGTNNIDNAARLCHAASTVALKETLGVTAATCSYTDWIGADLIVLLGSHLPNNQPVSMKYFYYAKKRGARIVVVNPFREPALERYWVPSIPKSAFFGTKMADEFFQVRVGGDIAFLGGVLKWLILKNWLDEKFIAEHTNGFDALKAALASQSWEELEESAGIIRDHMLRFAEIYAAAKNTVFIWSMGLTQHRFGVENVKAVVNLALARGNLGRPNAGLVPIRGHSGVQGAAECGSVPNTFPGGFPVNEENARRFSSLWGAPVPSSPGLSAPEMLDAAERGALDLFWCAGGNFLDTMPEPDRMRIALARVPVRVHQDLFLNSSMFVEPRDAVLLLPGRTRYEQPGGTVTSTERRIRFSPEIPGPRIGEAMSEWEIFMRAGEATLGSERRHLIHFENADALRGEMERAMPMYAGIASLHSAGDSVQYGGQLLCANGVCADLPGARARFTPLAPPPNDPVILSAPKAREESLFYLTTRRGKQFNSMLWSTRDPLTGSTRRDDIFISPEDAHFLGLGDGDPVLLRSISANSHGSRLPASEPAPVAPTFRPAFSDSSDRGATAVDAVILSPDGFHRDEESAFEISNLKSQIPARSFRGVCKISPVKPGTLQAFWPEANVLISSRLDPASHEPDYNAWVTLEKV
ncbi:MAG: FdhF/YdeP family oxidoreductase [Acidobacteria bacterium]|nr:FdhF/YdeP family oxidoreductase [Acidobacteriota bacterium]